VAGIKNWLFAGVPKGADASAMLFSLVEIAKANEITPSLPEISLRTLPRCANHGRNAGAHAAARGQIPSPKPPQAKAAQKVKTPASIADQARSWKMRTSERLQRYCFNQRQPAVATGLILLLTSQICSALGVTLDT
jgi:hypothetical protein